MCIFGPKLKNATHMIVYESQEKYQAPRMKVLRLSARALCLSVNPSTSGTESFGISGNNYDEDCWD